MAIGPNSPASGSNSVAANTWSDPGNCTSSDNSRARMTPLSSGSVSSNAFLNATNFFSSSSIPDSAVILGLVVEIEKFRDSGISGQIRDDTVQLIVNGSRSGDNKAQTGTDWPTSEAYATHGSSSDAWGLTLTGADVKDTDFGVAIRCVNTGTRRANVDHVRVTVYFKDVVLASTQTYTCTTQDVTIIDATSPIEVDTASFVCTTIDPSVLLAITVITQSYVLSTIDPLVLLPVPVDVQHFTCSPLVLTVYGEEDNVPIITWWGI